MQSKCYVYITLFILFLFNSINAHAQEESQNILFTVQPLNMCLQKGESCTLTCKAECENTTVLYRWYLTDQSGDNKTLIYEDWSETPDLEIEAFSEKGIRYYICEATTNKIQSVFSDIVVAAYTGLPIVYINTEVPIEYITKESYVFGNMKLGDFYYEFKTTKNEEKKEGIKGRGNSSWSMPKKGYNIKFDKKQSFFDLPAAKKWCINANYADKTLLRNKFASILGKEVFNSEWNPTFTSVDVVMNGEYLGNYIFMEKNTITEGRIDMQDISDYTEKKIEKGNYTDQNDDGKIDLYDGGFVFEICHRMDAEFCFKTSRNIPINLEEPNEISDDIKNHIIALIQSSEDILYSNDFLLEWRNYFDEKSVIDWYLINEFANNRDAKSYSSIYKYYSPHDKKIHFGPIWDFDLGFGNDSENGNIMELGQAKGWYIKDGDYIERMLEDPLFVANLKKRWNDKKSELYYAINTRLQELADDNAVSAEYNFVKWKILGQYVWPNPIGWNNRTTYQSEIDFMKNWLNERYEWLDNAINGILLPDFSAFTLQTEKINRNSIATYSGSINIKNSSDINDGDDVYIKIISVNYNFEKIEEPTATVTFMLEGKDKDKYSLLFDKKIFPITIEDNIETANSDIVVNDNVKIWSFDKTIFVENAEKEIVIVDITGRIIKKVNPISNRMEFQLNKGGFYIVKSGIVSKKVIVQ